MRILVVQTAFLGDVVLATSMLEQLHHCLPEAKIDILVRKGNEALLEGHPFLDNLLIWDKRAAKWKNLFALLKQIRNGRYDALINAQRFFSTGLLTALSKANKRIGYRQNPLSFLFTDRVLHRIDGRHEIHRNAELIDKLVLDKSEAFLPRLYPSAFHRDNVQRLLNGNSQPYYTLSPASVWHTKQYPPGKWIDLIDTLPAKASVFILGSIGDKKLCDTIAIGTNHSNTIVLCGQLQLLEIAALMEGAAMNYTNDSAPLHVASAMAAPVTAVFCSTSPRFGFGPLGPKGHIVQETVGLPCKPCGLHGYRKCPQNHFLCAKAITVQQFNYLNNQA